MPSSRRLGYCGNGTNYRRFTVHVGLTGDGQRLRPSCLDVAMLRVEARCLEGEGGDVDALAAAFPRDALRSV